ncbi:hypothetical protein [Halobacillus salinus]|uniref:hypothetical protein n=1 Tax=Halobacillus salinus TaxID=192814 RepID=UPI00130520DA|nr:hypothetical protein [Halobacillus salinus]
MAFELAFDLGTVLVFDQTREPSPIKLNQTQALLNQRPCQKKVNSRTFSITIDPLPVD